MKYHSPETGLPSEFSSMSWQDLENIAKYYNKMSINLNKRAQRLKAIQDMNERVEERVERFQNSYKTVIEYLDKGYNSVESAVSATARDLGVKDETIMGWWKWFVKTRDSDARKIRNEVIIKMVNLGLTNTEISDRMGVHTNTVSRAITEALHGSLRPVDRARLRKRRQVNP